MLRSNCTAISRLLYCGALHRAIQGAIPFNALDTHLGNYDGYTTPLAVAAVNVSDPQRMQQNTISEELADAVPSVLHIGQCGVPKRKKSVMRYKLKFTGPHFKHRFLRMEPWYFCPLCAEPKQPGTCCRREDCREIKP